MRHYKKGRKLGTSSAHTKAIKKNLLVALFTNDRIKTIDARAKEIRGDVDRVISWAKKGDLHSRRLAIAQVGDKELVREVFEKAAQGMWKDRTGGYTRTLKLGGRKCDNAPMVILELCTEPVAGATKKNNKKKSGAKSSAKITQNSAAKTSKKKSEDKPEDEKPEDSADKAQDAKPQDASDAAEEKSEEAKSEEAKSEDADESTGDKVDEPKPENETADNK